MQKGWSLFFGAVLLAELILLIVSPAMGWWLPENISTFGGEVDRLFYVIIGFTGFFFVLTEAILVYNMFAFAHREGHKSQYVEGNNRLELAWTIVPAAILLYIAYVQIETWAEIKYQTRTPEPDQVVQVTARQWEWRMRYYGEKSGDHYLNRPVSDGKFNGAKAASWAESPELDDYHDTNVLHTWEGANVKIYLKTNDVIHSFFVPTMRLKQDALPGKTIPIWFRVKGKENDEEGKANVVYEPAKEGKPGRLVPLNAKEYEITCAELCGGFHYRMRGMMYVHKDRASYEAWLTEAQEQQRGRMPKKSETASPTK